MDAVVTSGFLGGVMVGTLTRNASDADSIPALGTIFPIFIIAITISCAGTYIKKKAVDYTNSKATLSIVAYPFKFDS